MLPLTRQSRFYKGGSIHPHDVQFYQGRLQVIPELLQPAVETDYQMHLMQGRAVANRQLLRVANDLEGFRPVTDVDDIRARAKRRVDQVYSFQGSESEKLQQCESLALVDGVDFPDKSLSCISKLKRFQSVDWWARGLAVVHLRQFESAAIKAGRVHSGQDAYISNESLKIFRARQRRNAAILKRMTAVNTDTGESINLFDAVCSSVANPKNRRIEMMVRLRGMDEHSTAEGLEATFYTVTAASRFHPRKSKGGANPAFEGSTPRETHHHLTEAWARVRAGLKKKNIHYRGIRVVEPHHDGTPHWHLLVFSSKADVSRITGEIKRQFLFADNPGEKGAVLRRVKVERIDREKGSAVGYVAKYISKNIDGYQLKDSEVQGAERIRAWASLWGCRQFQFFGAPPVTVWREVRRMTEHENPVIAQLIELADSGDWAEYTRFCQRHDVQPVYACEQDAGLYGDDVLRVVGVSVDGEMVCTRVDEYEIEVFDGDESDIYIPAGSAEGLAAVPAHYDAVQAGVMQALYGVDDE